MQYYYFYTFQFSFGGFGKYFLIPNVINTVCVYIYIKHCICIHVYMCVCIYIYIYREREREREREGLFFCNPGRMCSSLTNQHLMKKEEVDNLCQM